jgi:hypothetical protein
VGGGLVGESLGAPARHLHRHPLHATPCPATPCLASSPRALLCCLAAWTCARDQACRARACVAYPTLLPDSWSLSLSPLCQIMRTAGGKSAAPASSKEHNPQDEQYRQILKNQVAITKAVQALQSAQTDTKKELVRQAQLLGDIHNSIEENLEHRGADAAMPTPGKRRWSPGSGSSGSGGLANKNRRLAKAPMINLNEVDTSAARLSTAITIYDTITSHQKAVVTHLVEAGVIRKMFQQAVLVPSADTLLVFLIKYVFILAKEQGGFPIMEEDSVPNDKALDTIVTDLTETAGAEAASPRKTLGQLLTKWSCDNILSAIVTPFMTLLIDKHFITPLCGTSLPRIKKLFDEIIKARKTDEGADEAAETEYRQAMAKLMMLRATPEGSTIPSPPRLLSRAEKQRLNALKLPDDGLEWLEKEAARAGDPAGGLQRYPRAPPSRPHTRSTLPPFARLPLTDPPLPLPSPGTIHHPGRRLPALLRRPPDLLGGALAARPDAAAPPSR